MIPAGPDGLHGPVADMRGVLGRGRTLQNFDVCTPKQPAGTARTPGQRVDRRSGGLCGVRVRVRGGCGVRVALTCALDTPSCTCCV